jgi:hypothetical protein
MITEGLTSIVIGIRNTDYPVCHYTGNCIGSVKYFTHKEKTPYEIIVVDNGSTVELGGWKWDQVVDKYYKHDAGMSCAWAWNKGIEMASGEYIAVLSNDVQIFEYWLEDLIDATKYVDIVNACPMYSQPWGRAVEAKELRNKWLMDDPDKYLYPFRDFSLFLGKREVFDKVGTFDENYEFGWGEDIDYCYRLQALGMMNKANKRVNTYHVGMATGQTLMMQNAGDINGAMTRNREYTRKKHNLDKFGIPHPQDEVVEHEKDPIITLSTKIKRRGDKTIRTNETGDKVYLVTGKVAQWVKNLETLNALGWTLGQEILVSLDEFRDFEMGEPLGLNDVEKGVGVVQSEVVVEATNYPEKVVVEDTSHKSPVLRYRKSV